MKRFVSNRILLNLAFTWLAGTIARADCGELVINSLDRGWYDSTGYHIPTDQNYFCGGGAAGGPMRNWFVFSVPVLTQQVTSASLVVRTFGISSPTGSETYQLRHVSTAVSTLRAGGTGLTGIFADLGDGTIYGSHVFLTSESQQQISIPLNGAFISNLLAAAGTTLAIGGEVSSLNEIPGNFEFLFGDSGTGPSNGVQLVLTFLNTSPLAITAQSPSETTLAGSNVTFRITACGSSPLSYQWQLNGTNLPGANGATLNLFNVTSNDAGTYRVIITNLSGAVTSTVATLSVDYALPIVASAKRSGTGPIYVGDSVMLCGSGISGAPFPSLHWQFNGLDLPFPTNIVSSPPGACLLLDNIQTNHSGEYRIIASNVVGVVTSSIVTLSVTTRPPVSVYFFSTPPIAVGSYAYMCADWRVPSPDQPSFQWRLNDSNLPGQTNACVYIRTVTTNDAGFYSVIASNSSGVYTSAPVELTVIYTLPTVLGPYFSLGGPAALSGNDIGMCVHAYGSPPLTYRWRRNGVDIPNSNTECLNLFAITTNQAGVYSVVVSNGAGAVTNEPVTLTVSNQSPIFIYQPQSQEVVQGSTVRFNTYASAGPPAIHVLQFNGTNTPVPFTFDVTAGFTLLDVTHADAGEYRVIASNIFGVATSLVATLTVTPAGPLDHWTQRNPLPQSQRILSLAHGNGLFVGVGERGTVMTSADGTNWFPQNRRVDLSLRGIVYDADLFVAVGDSSTVLTSADGTNWTHRYSASIVGSTVTDFNAVTYGNGRFVAVGAAPFQTLFVTSTNGVAWERVTVPEVSAELGITVGNGSFIAVGSTGIIKSEDGLNWTVILKPLPTALEHVSFLQDQFIAVGNNGYMLVSSNGTAWDSRNSTSTRRLLGVTYGNGTFVTAGVRGIIFTSPDTITWTAVNSGTPDRLETIDFVNGLFIAAGENGTTITSTNGTDWAKQNFGITRDLDGMAVANGMVVIVGKGGSILTTTDGAHYTQQDAGVTNDFHGLAWGNGLWVAVGEPGIILTSSNAVDWTSQTTGNTNSLKGATYADGKWIVVGTQGAVITSTNGVNWLAAVTTPPFDLNDVAYGNGRFVIAADGPNSQNGSAFVSSNAITWTWVAHFNFSKNLRGILFTNGIFLATGNDGIVFISTNGLNWVGRSIGAGNLRAVTWVHGYWALVGNFGTILTSTNSLDWRRRPSRTFENIHEVVYLDGKLVAIGNRGTILQSDRFITDLESPQYHPSLGTSLAVKGILGQVYDFQASTDLLQWTNVLQFTNTSERAVLTDMDAAGRPHRFYRVIPH